MQKYKLAISLFYHHEEWNFILCNGVMPFLHEMKRKYNYVYTLIFLNNERGDNIRLLIDLNADDVPGAFHYTDTFFSSFF